MTEILIWIGLAAYVAAGLYVARWMAVAMLRDMGSIGNVDYIFGSIAGLVIGAAWPAALFMYAVVATVRKGVEKRS